MSNTDIHHLAAAYALDALDARERAEFEAHYPSCDVCSSDVVDFRATLARLAEAEVVAPPAGMKATVMRQISETRQLSPLPLEADDELAEHRRRRSVRSSQLAVAAAVVVLVGVAAFFVGRSGSSDGGTFAAKVERILGESDARLVTLAGPGQGDMKVAWSERADQAVVIGDGLDDPGSGMVYELWLIDASGPQPMGLLDEARGGSLRRTVVVDGTPQAWGITIEPAAGSPAPTGEILFSAAADDGEPTTN